MAVLTETVAVHRLHVFLASRRARTNGHVCQVSVVPEAQGLGLPFSNTPRTEPGTMEWLIGNRDRIREYKRAWLKAYMANDYQEAEKVAGDFARAYPQVRGGLPSMMKKQDILIKNSGTHPAKIKLSF